MNTLYMRPTNARENMPAALGGRLGRRRNRGGLSRPVRNDSIFAASRGRSASAKKEIIEFEPPRNKLIIVVGHYSSHHEVAAK